MNKTELLKKIDSLVEEAKKDEENSKMDIERMFYIGKQNGLLWARIFLIDLEEK